MPTGDLKCLSNKEISIVVLANCILTHFGFGMPEEDFEAIAAENARRQDIAEATQVCVCQGCGSNNVEIKVWQNLKTGEIDDSNSDQDEPYCNTCREHTMLDVAYAVKDLGCFIRLCGDIEIRDGKRHSELETCAMMQDGEMNMGDKGPNWYNPDFYHNEGTEDFDRFIRTAEYCYPDVIFKRT